MHILPQDIRRCKYGAKELCEKTSGWKIKFTLAASKRKGVFDKIQNKTIQRLWNKIKMWRREHFPS